jgi:hypothetical protein
MGELWDKLSGEEAKEKSQENLREKFGPTGESYEDKQQAKDEYGPVDDPIVGPDL